jgi:hypothetical protein
MLDLNRSIFANFYLDFYQKYDIIIKKGLKMSTQINIYYIVGYKFNYKEFNKTFKKSPDDDSAFETIEPIYDSAFEGIKDGLTALFDGNSGQYVVIGKVLNKTQDGQPFDDLVIEFKNSLKERKKEKILRK